jgi:DtxR family Mn-dependent transcriptional regulator
MTEPGLWREEEVEELLERLWVQEEEGDGQGLALSELGKDARFLRHIGGGAAGEDAGLPEGDALEAELRKIEADGLISIRGGRLILREKGREAARNIIRSHRLAERLLMEVLEVGEVEADASACRFEHILSREVTERVCTFLGHPPTCPHGKAIPRGECCRVFGRHIEPLVKPLTDLEVGRRARIVFITPSYQARLERLSALGLAPGEVLRLRQRHPSYVVEVDETTIALDRHVGGEIFVREVS